MSLEKSAAAKAKDHLMINGYCYQQAFLISQGTIKLTHLVAPFWDVEE